MNEEILVIPYEHLEGVVKVIRQGLKEAEIDDSIIEQLEIWCDNMEDELKENS